MHILFGDIYVLFLSSSEIEYDTKCNSILKWEKQLIDGL